MNLESAIHPGEPHTPLKDVLVSMVYSVMAVSASTINPCAGQITLCDMNNCNCISDFACKLRDLNTKSHLWTRNSRAVRRATKAKKKIRMKQYRLILRYSMMMTCGTSHHTTHHHVAGTPARSGQARCRTAPSPTSTTVVMTCDVTRNSTSIVATVKNRHLVWCE